MSETAKCCDCGHTKDDSRFHLDSPGTNWGAALHWFKPPAPSAPPSTPAAPRNLCPKCHDYYHDDPVLGAYSTCGHNQVPAAPQTKPDRAAARELQSAGFTAYAGDVPDDDGQWEIHRDNEREEMAAIISRHYLPLVEAAEQLLSEQSTNRRRALRAALDAVRGKK